MRLFELVYFLAYTKQLMQINKFLCAIHKLVKVVYEKKMLMKIQFLLVGTYELK